MLKKLQADKDKVHDLSLKEALSITKYGSRFNIDHKLWQFIFSNFTYYHPTQPLLVIHKQVSTLLPWFLLEIREGRGEGMARDTPAENSVINSKNKYNLPSMKRAHSPTEAQKKGV